MKTETVFFDEVIVRPVPEATKKKSTHHRNGWNRRMTGLAFKKIRRRIIDKYGLDLVQMVPMDDCLEVRFRGKVECMVIEKKTKPRRLFTPEEIRQIRDENWNEKHILQYLGKKVPQGVATAIRNRSTYKDVE